ncbi:MAG: hypothetical protein QW331_01040 [Candidatus Woesearchaeota archaeon]
MTAIKYLTAVGASIALISSSSPADAFDKNREETYRRPNRTHYGVSSTKTLIGRQVLSEMIFGYSRESLETRIESDTGTEFAALRLSSTAFESAANATDAFRGLLRMLFSPETYAFHKKTENQN